MDCFEISKFIAILGSGTGQHVAHFAEALPFIEFQPTDLNNKLFENIACLRDQNKLTNILDPVIVDLTHSPNRWPVPHEYYDLMLCSNVLHISPFETSTGLFDGARHCLRPSSGVLLVYGPFAVNGKIEPKSNQDFNESLRARNSQWGLRDVRMLTRLAEKNGLHLKQIIDMPANNKILYFSFKPN